MIQSDVKVSDAITALKSALIKLENLDPTLPVTGNVDEGGYMDVGLELTHFSLSVNHVNDKEEDVNYVEIIANLYD